MNAMASQITGVSIVCSTVCSDADKNNIRGDYPHKGPAENVSIWWRHHDVFHIQEYADSVCWNQGTFPIADIQRNDNVIITPETA